jgi:hypothetical protein
VGKEAALAHAKLRSERTNGEAVEAVHRSNIHGAGEDGFAGAKAPGLPARNASWSRGAEDRGHKRIVTHGNK